MKETYKRALKSGNFYLDFRGSHFIGGFMIDFYYHPNYAKSLFFKTEKECSEYIKNSKSNFKSYEDFKNNFKKQEAI